MKECSKKNVPEIKKKKKNLLTKKKNVGRPKKCETYFEIWYLEKIFVIENCREIYFEHSFTSKTQFYNFVWFTILSDKQCPIKTVHKT